jgi:UDP-N-acetylmuramate--alanine ligase
VGDKLILRQWLADRFGQTPVYMTGIKGQGMSALARVLAANGVQIIGSDTAASFVTDFRLQHPNIKVLTGFSPGQIPAEARQYIYSAGYPQEHAEIVAARQRGMAVASYPEFMGQISQVVPTVAVAGTHGKTTTVQMIGHLLRETGFDPVVVSGGGEVGTGSGDVMVLESCEYRRHFLNYRPKWSVITNIEFDHPDFYPDLEAVTAAFADFANVVRPDGAVILTDNCPRSVQLAIDPPRGRVLCGLGKDAEVSAVVYATGPCRFDVLYAGQHVGRANTQLWGLHNVYNSLQGLAVTRAMGIDPAAAIAALDTFPGVPRRLAYLGTVGRAKIMDDFAHHPSEIASSIKALREMGPSRLVIVFQPHTFSRTRALLPEFGEALGVADEVALIPIYGSVREPTGDISSEALVKYLPADKVRVVPNEGLVDYLHEIEAPGMMIVFMGAGDIGTIAQEVFAAAGGVRGVCAETCQDAGGPA